jgi:hypothetical protein
MDFDRREDESAVEWLNRVGIGATGSTTPTPGSNPFLMGMRTGFGTVAEIRAALEAEYPDEQGTEH